MRHFILHFQALIQKITKQVRIRNFKTSINSLKRVKNLKIRSVFGEDLSLYDYFFPLCIYLKKQKYENLSKLYSLAKKT